LEITLFTFYEARLLKAQLGLKEHEMAAANSGSVGRGKPLWSQRKVDPAITDIREAREHKSEPCDQRSTVLSTTIVVRRHSRE
jgi:hypothetical protein